MNYQVKPLHGRKVFKSSSRIKLLLVAQSLLLCFCLLATANTSAAELSPSPFTFRDFSATDLFLSGPSKPKYSRWLATQSNYTYMQMGKEKPLLVVLAELGKSRKKFQKVNFGTEKDEDGAVFGEPRMWPFHNDGSSAIGTNESNHTLRRNLQGLGLTEDMYDKIAASSLRQAVSKRVVETQHLVEWQQTETPKFLQKLRSIKSLEPEDELGTTLVLASFKVGHWIFVSHSNVNTSVFLLDKSLQFLSEAIASKNNQIKIEAFIRSAYNYYHSLYFLRGSSSIGQAFFP